MDQHTRPEAPLTSWKEIGAYIGRNDATARRWEKKEGLPVHRQTHKRRASVYAYCSEINAWWASRKTMPEPPLLWKTLLTGPAVPSVRVGAGALPGHSRQRCPSANRFRTGHARGCCDSAELDSDLFRHDFTTETNRRLTDTARTRFALRPRIRSRRRPVSGLFAVGI
jgi:hypothetical protein